MEWILVSKYVGAGLAIGIAAFGSAFGEGLIAFKASESIARQPKASSEIVRTMLITQAIAETSGIFGLLVSVILLFVISKEGTTAFAFGNIAAGFCIGVGAIGAGIGSGQAGGAACESIGRHPRLSPNILITTLVGQAVVQTGCIFAMVVSMFLVLTKQSSDNIAVIGSVLGAGICMGLGAIGSDNGTGIVAKKAIWGMSRDSRNMGMMTRTMLLGQAVSITTAIYSLIIAFLLILTGEG